MGHGSYSQDVAHANRGRGAAWKARESVHPDLDPKAGPREVNNETPIVVAMDVTRSRGNDTRVLYEQLPKLMKHLDERGYVEGPGISFAAIGDVYADKAPLQVSQFEADNRLDAALLNVWIEEGGGGSGQESYEFAAWYYAATDCVALREGRGGKGFFFFIGDEGFYPTVSGVHRAAVLGQAEEDLDTAAAFRALHEKFHVFLIYPGKTMEERKSDIDAEVRKRVLSAGGQYDNVDVRVSLIWDNRNDLDLHVTTPGGEIIFYGMKASKCGGVLDVDRNIRGETTTPVENVRWPTGTAPEGQYKVVVKNFKFHESVAPTPFRVETEVDGELSLFEGVISPNGEVRDQSAQTICTFSYTPSSLTTSEQYKAYSEEVVLGQWTKPLQSGHILKLRDAKLITHVLLGAVGIANGVETLEGYRAHLISQELSADAVADVMTALQGVVPLRSA